MGMNESRKMSGDDPRISIIRRLEREIHALASQGCTAGYLERKEQLDRLTRQVLGIEDKFLEYPQLKQMS